MTNKKNKGFNFLKKSKGVVYFLFLNEIIIVNPIVVIDSGLGGLTVFDAIHERLPEWPLVYCFDNAVFPYGEKSEQAVVQRIRFCIEELYRYITPSMIVVACNTASTVVLPMLRQWLDIPVVGVVPAIKPAAIASKKHCIGLLATPGTINRTYTAKLIGAYAGACHVISIGNSELVQMAEQKLQGQAVCLTRLKHILLPFIDAQVVPDYVVLGCTHFPWLIDELTQSYSEEDIQWIDSSKAVAQRVASLLPCERYQSKQKWRHLTFCTKKQVFNEELQVIFSQRQLSFPQYLEQPLCGCPGHSLSVGL